MSKYYQEYFERARQGLSGRAPSSPAQPDSEVPSAAEASKWYEEELEEMEAWDDSAYAGRSVSATRSILGHYAQSDGPVGAGASGKLNKVGCELVRLMNSVRNTSFEGDDVEKVLSIRWARKHGDDRNDPGKPHIAINPDYIIGADGTEDNSKTPEVVDALGGQLLLGATLKRTMSKQSIQEAARDCADGHDMVREIWQATETAIARQELLSNWPGAAAYLWRHQALMCDGQEQADVFVASNRDNLAGAVAALCWRLTNPKHQLSCDSIMATHLNKAAEMLGESKKTKRYQLARRVYDYLASHFQKPPEEPGEGEGGTSSGSGPGSSDDGSGEPPPASEPSEPGDQTEKSDSEPEPEKPKPEKPESDGGDDNEGGSKPEPKPEPETTTAPKDTNPGESSSDDVKSDGDGTPTPGDGGATKPGRAPRITDNTLFGDVVPSSMIDGVSDLSQDADLDKFDVPEIPNGCAIITGLRIRDDPSVSISYGCRSNDHAAIYNRIALAARPVTQAIIQSLRFRASDRSMPVHGLYSGEMDDGSLFKIANRRDQHPAVFERYEVPGIPDVAIGILVDESGSMHEPVYDRSITDKSLFGLCDSNHHYRFEAARFVAIAMVEAFTRLKGLHVAIWGHTQHTMDGVDLFPYLDKDHHDKTRLTTIKSRGNNADGYAMEHCMRLLNEFKPDARQKYLFVISDGLPHANGRSSYGGRDDYGSVEARQHMRNVSQWGLRKYRIRTFGFGVQGSPNLHDGEEMYGRGHFVEVKQMDGIARLVSQFLSRVTSKV